MLISWARMVPVVALAWKAEARRMKAVTWHGKRDVRVEEVSDPTIRHLTDAIIRVMERTRLSGHRD
jgi:Alcohol dehydrogenase GroES-associated